MDLILIGHSYKYELESLANMFFSQNKVRVIYEDTRGENDYIYTEVLEENGVTTLFLEFFYQGEKTVMRQEQKKNETQKRETEYLFCRMLYVALEKSTGETLAWGMLTGVRPVRLVYRYWNRGMNDEAVVAHLQEKYFVQPQKAQLLLDTAKKEKKITALSTSRSASLYVSIPFCPSRCSYCSFVSHSVSKAQNLIPLYTDHLVKELLATAQIIKKLHLRLETVYFGGGTPTSLSAELLKRLLQTIKDSFDLSTVREYTVEAGRPDTVDKEKLMLLKEYGVSRISINPQSTNNLVLQNIGREHSAEDFFKAFSLAKACGHENINTDLIAGLPGDTLRSFEKSVEELLALNPENITLHTLALKRSSDFGSSPREEVLKQKARIASMLDLAAERFSASGYEPYYLYRQKSSLDNLENVGYCKPNREGLYNIYIMDETHTILAAGAGAVTKVVRPHEDKIRRIFNFKFPYEYISRFDQILERKKEIESLYL